MSSHLEQPASETELLLAELEAEEDEFYEGFEDDDEVEEVEMTQAPSLRVYPMKQERQAPVVLLYVLH